MTITKRAAIYRRISTTGQEDNTSLDGQLDACKKYAAQNGFNIVADFSDVASGETLDRPGFKKLMQLMESKALDAVIVYHQDRLSRNLINTLSLIQTFSNLEVELHDTTQGEIRDSLLSTITAVISAEEKKNTRRRMQKGLKDKVSSGKIAGQGHIAPYGYQFEGTKETKKLVINEIEAAIIRLIYRWYLEGMSIRAITVKLSEQRISTPRDNGRKTNTRIGKNQRDVGQWNFSTVWNILRDTRYIGTVQHFKFNYKTTINAQTGKRFSQRVSQRSESDWISVQIDRIIDQITWDAAQARLSTAKQMSTRNTKHHYLLGRRIKCACGAAMCGNFSMDLRYYRCSASTNTAAKRCTFPQIKAEQLEPVVWTAIERQLEPTILRAGLEHERAQSANTRQKIHNEQMLLQQQLAALDTQLQRIRAAYVAGVFDLETTATEQGKLDAAKRNVNAELAQLQTQLAAIGLSDEETAELLAAAAELHNEVQYITSDEKRRWLIDMLDIRVQMERDELGAWWINLSGRLAIQAQRLPLADIVSTGYASSIHNPALEYRLTARFQLAA